MPEVVRPPKKAPELEMLPAFFDAQRDALLRKVRGASDEDVRKRLVPAETTLLGLVKHLAFVERGWFQHVFAGREGLEFPDDDDDEFRIQPHETTGDIIRFYEAECAISRELIAGASPEDHARRPDRQDYTLRWIMMHMIEETARHAGHADILREQIDGTTGD